MKRFRGGLVFKAHRLCLSLNSRLERNKEERGETDGARHRAEEQLLAEGHGLGLACNTPPQGVRTWNPLLLKLTEVPLLL